jgi:hypothetical protein
MVRMGVQKKGDCLKAFRKMGDCLKAFRKMVFRYYYVDALPFTYSDFFPIF